MQLYLLYTGIFFCFAAACFTYLRIRFLLYSTCTQGVLERWAGNRDVEYPDSFVFYPMIAFEDGEGTSHRFTSQIGYPSESLPVGSVFPVRYLTKRPEKAEINTVFALAAAPVALWVLGIASVLGSR